VASAVITKAILKFEWKLFMPPLELIKPTLEHLDSYIATLREGWSPSSIRPEQALEELDNIERDPAAFLAKFDDLDAKGGLVTLPDGSQVPRLPGFRRWMWDGEFCGSIGFRWQPGTEALPPNCMGHIGYNVPPNKRRCGYATEGLRLILQLPELRAAGLAYVDMTTTPDNLPSQKAILANGGQFVERFTKIAALGGTEELRFRIYL
jgi:predicted acetyltransferase